MAEKHFVVSEATDVAAFLGHALHGVKRSRIAQLLKFGSVCVNGVAVRRADQRLESGDALTIAFDTPRKVPGGDLTVIYEDADIIVVNKPAGLLTIATESEREQTAHAILNAWLQPKRGRIWIVHRLDRGTSGLLVFARSEAVKRRLQDGWASVDKHYTAVVEGTVTPPEGTIRSYLRETATLQVVSTPDPRPDARQAVTHYRVVRTTSSRTLLELHLETGRKHQIRVHLSGLGHPVVGDDRYGAKTDPLKRLALHAERLSLDHPRTGLRVQFNAPSPRVLTDLVPNVGS